MSLFPLAKDLLPTNRQEGQGDPAADGNDQGSAINAIQDYLGTLSSSDPSSVTYRILQNAARLSELEVLLADYQNQTSMTPSSWIEQARLERHIPTANTFQFAAQFFDSTIGLAAGTPVAVTTARTPQQPGPYVVPLGKAWVLEGFSIGSTKAIRGYLREFPITTQGVPTGEINGAWDSQYGGFVVQANDMIYKELGPRLIAENQVISPFLSPAQGEADFGNISYDPNFFQITNDFNFGAKHKIVVLGNSVWHTIMGNYDGTNGSSNLLYTDAFPRGEMLAAFRIRDALKALGADVRLINLSYGGATAKSLVTFLEQGRWDGVKGGLFIIDTNLNDPASNTSERDLAQSRYERIGRWVRRNNPEASILFCQMGPSDSSEKIAKRANLRTAVLNAAAALGGAPARVYVGDLAGAFDSVGGNNSTTAFANNEAAGAKIHPNQLGHKLYADALLPTIQNTYFCQTQLGITSPLVNPVVAGVPA